jgi:hypothetical protein
VTATRGRQEREGDEEETGDGGGDSSVIDIATTLPRAPLLCVRAEADGTGKKAESAPDIAESRF